MSSETLKDQTDVGSVKIAKESREKAKLGKPSKYLGIQKLFLFIFAILAAGLLQLVIIILFAQFGT